MKNRLIAAFVFTFVIAFSIALTGEKSEKSAKTNVAKKETKGCCMDGGKDAKGCSDMEMKGAKSEKKSPEAKSEVKSEKKEQK